MGWVSWKCFSFLKRFLVFWKWFRFCGSFLGFGGVLSFLDLLLDFWMWFGFLELSLLSGKVLYSRTFVVSWKWVAFFGGRLVF